MSVEIWPHVAPDQLKAAIETAEKRELDWLIDELRETLTNLKHGLEDCYALLAPIDPGSTLVLSTPRNEVVKGHVTRVGTRIVKGTIHLRLRTLPQQTLTINPDHPIHLTSLTTLHSLLTHSIDLLALTLSYSYPSATPTAPLPTDLPPPHFLSAQLRLLAQSLAEASTHLKGTPQTAPDPSWTTLSASPSHFTPPLPQPHTNSSHPSLSFHLSIQDSSLVLWLRALEPADAPLNFGTKLALAIGTTRRLEHDESEKVFGYCCNGNVNDAEHTHSTPPAALPQEHTTTATSHTPPGNQPVPLSGTRKPNNSHSNNSSSTTKHPAVDVFVREKVRVESADPSLLSLSAKLTALGHTLALARRNLAAVMGEEVGGEGGED
ncbi:RAVE subunit 2/Rogdi [Parachaetomium inaequale]|uniref:RAVE subunit 2/Rogdi n=1 Tax=Parachaetomium inaequale TaxID=2588326 RepID=A0AAN6PIC9_9PEZI|nr:RAVE subunit 2/Rogdi [Parachaetomium inaequale]